MFINLGKFNIKYRGALIWNRILSLGINPCTSEAVFMKAIKRAVLNKSLRIDNIMS